MKKVLLITSISLIGCVSHKSTCSWIDDSRGERINYLEDMIEYMWSDINDGVIDSSYGETYIMQFEKLVRLNKKHE